MWFEGKMTVFGGCFREWKCSRTDTSWSFSKYLMPFFAKDNQIAICNLTVAMDSVFSFKNPFYHSWFYHSYHRWFVAKMTGFFLLLFGKKGVIAWTKVVQSQSMYGPVRTLDADFQPSPSHIPALRHFLNFDL